MRKKKKKLEPIPKINRRLFKKWSEIVRKNQKCEYCGRKVGELSVDGKPLVKIDAHHLQSRKIKDNPLKWDVYNSVAVCPLHHKFSTNESFHRSPVITVNWLIKNHPERFHHILKHFNDTVDLQNREVLKEIERCLDEAKPLDISKLKEIERQYPRNPSKIQPRARASLFDSDNKSSSSSSD